MKEYPSIPRSTGQSFAEFSAYVFDKLDGSNIRAEWSRKRGWTKFGSRTRLLDESDPILGSAKGIFLELLAEPLAKIARDNRWEGLTAFAEFWGPNSFAGWHDPADTKTLTLFDLAPHKQGILGPREFLDLCKHLPIAKFLGHYQWTRGFVEKVRAGEISCTFEGVVGKGGSGHHQVRAKAKTQAWIDKVLARYGAEEGSKIVNS